MNNAPAHEFIANKEMNDDFVTGGVYYDSEFFDLSDMDIKAGKNIKSTVRMDKDFFNPKKNEFSDIN